MEQVKKKTTKPKKPVKKPAKKVIKKAFKKPIKKKISTVKQTSNQNVIQRVVINNPEKKKTTRQRRAPQTKQPLFIPFPQIQQVPIQNNQLEFNRLSEQIREQEKSIKDIINPTLRRNTNKSYLETRKEDLENTKKKEDNILKNIMDSRINKDANDLFEQEEQQQMKDYQNLLNATKLFEDVKKTNVSGGGMSREEAEEEMRRRGAEDIGPMHTFASSNVIQEAKKINKPGPKPLPKDPIEREQEKERRALEKQKNEEEKERKAIEKQKKKELNLLTKQASEKARTRERAKQKKEQIETIIPKVTTRFYKSKK
jgi:hypothetical protein